MLYFPNPIESQNSFSRKWTIIILFFLLQCIIKKGIQDLISICYGLFCWIFFLSSFHTIFFFFFSLYYYYIYPNNIYREEEYISCILWNVRTKIFEYLFFLYIYEFTSPWKIYGPFTKQQQLFFLNGFFLLFLKV